MATKPLLLCSGVSHPAAVSTFTVARGEIFSRAVLLASAISVSRGMAFAPLGGYAMVWADPVASPVAEKSDTRTSGSAFVVTWPSTVTARGERRTRSTVLEGFRVRALGSRLRLVPRRGSM